jgi:hypothetical protein
MFDDPATAASSKVVAAGWAEYNAVVTEERQSPAATADHGLPVFARYYSLARYALVDALRAAGIGAGASVLLPEFTCRDLLAALAAVGARACWYAVGKDLLPRSPWREWPEAQAVLAVNYFGFAQPLEPFRSYARVSGALLIEDNAHGFLSCDKEGVWLGTRADCGLFSIRKTLLVSDGAALFVADPRLLVGLPKQIPFAGEGLAPAQVWKKRMRQSPGISRPLMSFATGMVRSARWLRRGYVTPPPDAESECRIPAAPTPWAGLPQVLRELRPQTEIERRRALYAKFQDHAASYGVEPVFDHLPDNCAPYGFPFRGDARITGKMKTFASRCGLDVINWPDLPAEVQARAPAYYRDLWLVNFLW